MRRTGYLSLTCRNEGETENPMKKMRSHTHLGKSSVIQNDSRIDADIFAYLDYLRMISPRPILLVEDSFNDAELTITALKANNVANEIHHVRNGEEALNYLKRQGPFQNRHAEQPAVVFLDLKMPKVDGIDVLRAAKADPELRSIPIVMLTSSRENVDLSTCYNLGVNAYVVKPVGFEQFADAIRQLGLFWALLNEPAPVDGNSRREEAS